MALQFIICREYWNYVIIFFFVKLNRIFLLYAKYRTYYVT